MRGLERIVKKGMGACYSIGSRPNQTPLSRGNARLGNSITGNKASVVDNHILREDNHILHASRNIESVAIIESRKN